MIELNKIYLDDCLNILKGLPSNSIDLIITDPPYGIDMANGVAYGSSTDKSRIYDGDWDKKPPTKELFDELLRVGKKVIIFGGNYFTDRLPVSTHWLVWDKKGHFNFENPFSDCELIWTNINRKNTKKYTVVQQGFVSDGDERIHPTQKPQRLIEMIIKDYAEDNDIIGDFFSGSGTVCVCAKESGHKFVGVEINEEFYVKSINRLKGMTENGQTSIFTDFEELK